MALTRTTSPAAPMRPGISRIFRPAFGRVRPVAHGRHPRRIAVATLLIAGLLSPAAVVHAYKGQCSQPVTNGASVTATDCLYVLKVAVGVYTCTPACACAPRGTLPTKASDALLCLRRAVGQAVSLLCPCEVSVADDFNDNSRDATKWYGTDHVDNFGVLTESGHALQYTCNSATFQNQSLRTWIGSLLPYATDWEVQIDVANSTVGVGNNDVDSFGLSITDLKNGGSEVFAELYVSHAGGPPSRSGFYAEMSNNNTYVGYVDTGSLPATMGAVRVAFDAATKVVRLYYDANTGNGYSWSEFGSFGLAGAGGSAANSNWGLNVGDRFTVSVYGYSTMMLVTAGQMSGDNFHVTGGVYP